MDYESKYKSALKWAMGIYPNAVGADREDLEHYFPELAESEDERIRKELIKYFRALKGGWFTHSNEQIIAWLEKQCKPIDEEKVLIGARKDVALSIINYLDNNSVGMCLSNIECEDIEDACVNSKWIKLYNYMKKKLEKQGSPVLSNSSNI